MFYSRATFRYRTSVSFISVHASLHYLKQVGVPKDSQLVNKEKNIHPEVIYTTKH